MIKSGLTDIYHTVYSGRLNGLLLNEKPLFVKRSRVVPLYNETVLNISKPSLNTCQTLSQAISLLKTLFTFTLPRALST